MKTDNSIIIEETESLVVPMHAVWWSIVTKHGTPAYTKARLWVEARAAFGGACDPARVRDAGTLERLERYQALEEDGEKP